MEMVYSVIDSSKVKKPETIYDKELDCFFFKKSAIAFNGLCVVIGEADNFFGGVDSKNYCSKVLENPTWGDLFRIAKQQMKVTRDYSHCFFESYQIVGKAEFGYSSRTIYFLKLFLGS